MAPSGTVGTTGKTMTNELGFKHQCAADGHRLSSGETLEGDVRPEFEQEMFGRDRLPCGARWGLPPDRRLCGGKRWQLTCEHGPTCGRLTESAKYAKWAADQNDPWAQIWCAHCLGSGIGVPIDLPASARY
jgi:hypothetical protein